MEHYSHYFYGNKISDYGIRYGYVDYATLAKAFDCVLNNGIIENTAYIGYWEQVSGFVDNSEIIERFSEMIAELEEQEDTEEEIAEIEERIAELEERQEIPAEIFQYYIVSDNGAAILEEANEIVFYNEELDMYVWGVTHFGTSWSYVLTDIRIVEE